MDISPYFTIYNNSLCSPYPECIENYVGEQDTSECPEYLLGDVNFDGDINIFDVISGLQIILGNIDPSTSESYVLDYNQDGSTDVLDIVEMVNYILDI